MLHEFVEDVLM